MCKKMIGLKILKGVLCVAVMMIITGCDTESYCMYPGCKEVQMDEETGLCYRHEKKIYSNNNDNEQSSSTKKNTSVSNYASSSNNSAYKPQKSVPYTIDVTDYDNPDDYASDFAEDYAYDEFAEDSDYAYDYGYEAAYEHWMDEMGE